MTKPFTQIQLKTAFAQYSNKKTFLESVSP